MDVDELQHALGGIVLEAAYMERVLRAVFSALVGSKYAAVVDGRLTASGLIEDCEHLTNYHMDIPAQARGAVLAALRACHEANRERNRVIHDTWATLAEVRQLADQVADAAEALKAAMTQALGSGWERVEDQLRLELGHDIGTDQG